MPPHGGFSEIDAEAGSLLNNNLGDVKISESRTIHREPERFHGNDPNLAALVLAYTKRELTSNTRLRIAGISKASVPWMKRCSLTFWHITKGKISKEQCDALRRHRSTRFADLSAQRKVLNFATAFLKYLAKTPFDTRYMAFDLFLEMPKRLKTRKHVTDRIIPRDDVNNVLSIIEAHQNREIDTDLYVNNRTIVLRAFTGQRPQATTARLKVGQFREAISDTKPAIDVLPEQDKIRFQHYCPIHPQVSEAMIPLLGDRADDECAFKRVFKHLLFERWLKQQEVLLVYGEHLIVPGDLRKFCEQMRDILEWAQRNKNYILTHGVSG